MYSEYVVTVRNGEQASVYQVCRECAYAVVGREYWWVVDEADDNGWEQRDGVTVERDNYNEACQVCAGE